MKTKIIYISGNEIFNISDIRAAFEEVRNALQLDSETVLFGVPVDKEDAGFGETEIKPTTPEIVNKVLETSVPEPEPTIIEETIEEPTEEPVVEIKKRGRPRKMPVVEEIIEEPVSEIKEEPEEKIVPILSVLATKEEESQPIEIIEEETIIDDSVEEESEITTTEITDDVEPESLNEEIPETHPIDDSEEDLEKLLSAIKPLDAIEDIDLSEPEKTITPEPENIDATLEQLATEFVASQDKINEETKSNSRSKIGKLRNILPFKQSKNKDSQGLGDLFGWAGMAANDEDFSVPGFFTNAASKK